MDVIYKVDLTFFKSCRSHKYLSVLAKRKFDFKECGSKSGYEFRSKLYMSDILDLVNMLDFHERSSYKLVIRPA